MTNRIYDGSNPLPTTGVDALLVLSDAGSTIIDLAVTSTDKVAIQATAMQQILISATRNVQGHSFGLELRGNGSSVTNYGTVGSDTTSAILFSGGGTSTVTNSGTITGAEGIQIDSTSTTAKLSLFNSGTITASGIAIEGGKGDDRIANLGTITTTTIGTKLINLADGNDFFDSQLGTTSGIIDLGAGNDTAYGSNGSETFIGGAGTDYIDGGGGTGIDVIDYSGVTNNGITVNLGLSNSQFISSDQGFDTLLDIEGVIGGTRNDTLTGSSGDNTLNGGDGFDTVLYTGPTAVQIDLSLSTPQTNFNYGKDVLISIENVEGGSGADTLMGNDAANKLTGNGSNDTLKGGKGNDTLEGGAGADILVGGVGNDTLDGGSGEDTAEFSGNRANYTWSVNADGSYKITDTTGADGEDTLKDIRILKFADGKVALSNATPSAIFFSISNVSESIAPGKIADIYGSDSDGDTLNYTLVDSFGGLFSINGDELILNRPLDYEVAKQHVISIKATDSYGGEFTKAITLSVRNVIETTPLVLSGTAGTDTLSGESGNDRLSGLAGGDSLYGNDGADTLVGGAGIDVMFGGAGKDVFVFDTKPNVKTNVEYLYDFNVADDTIHLKLSAFKGIGHKGTLSKVAFWTGTKVHDSNDHILYNKKTGALFFDPDGTGSKPALQIAVMLKNLKLTHKDFLII
ncbi:hypothetical protein AB4097_20405 [Microvirga sp. 2MCAF35]|uniref:hypothetical protein n=1 Tax=Microvirga sp. 2MCAF35 TaxID=3232987 RepID=UPI003F9B8EFC